MVQEHRESAGPDAAAVPLADGGDEERAAKGEQGYSSWSSLSWN